MIARGYSRPVLDQPKDGAVRVRGSHIARSAVLVSSVVGREFTGRPDHAACMLRPPGDHVLGELVDADDRATILIVACDDTADFQGHRASSNCLSFFKSLLAMLYTVKRGATKPP